MASDDSAEAKVAAAVAVTAALSSPRVRTLLRRAAVQGLAGVLTAGDALISFARGVSRGIEDSTRPAARAETAPTEEPTRSVSAAATAGPSAGATTGDARGRPPRRARTRPPVDRQAESTVGDQRSTEAIAARGAASGE